MRITESQLRRIIRQEARRLTEMPARMRTPTDDRKLYNTYAVSALNNDHYRDMQNFKSEAPAEFKKFLQLVWRESNGGMDVYGRDGQGFEEKLAAAMDAAGVSIEGKKLKRLAGGGVPLPTRTGTAPRIRGGSPNDRAIAQDALDMLYAGEDALESVVPYIVEQTLTYGGDEYHDAESSRPRPEGDRAHVIVNLIRKVDPAAADELTDALDGYVHY